MLSCLGARIGDMESARVEDVGTGIESYVFTGPKAATRVLWASDPEKPRTIVIETRASVTVSDIYGGSTKMQPQNGKVTLPLTDVPVYLDGAVDVESPSSK